MLTGFLGNVVLKLEVSPQALEALQHVEEYAACHWLKTHHRLLQQLQESQKSSLCKIVMSVVT